MSIAHLNPRRAADRSHATASRKRLARLLDTIDENQLEVAEEFLTELIDQRAPDPRGLTVSETDALSRLGVSKDALSSTGPLPARTRSAVWEAQAQQLSFTVAEVAAMLGVTTARVRQRCADGTLVAQRLPGGWSLPRFQFPEGRELPGWSVVAPKIQPDTPILLADRVLTTPAPGLTVAGEAVSPFEWLSQHGNAQRAAVAVDDALQRMP